MRIAGTVAILVGVVALGLDVSRLDAVLWTVSSTHGIHISDVLGVGLVLGGIAALWTAPPRGPR